MTGRRYLLLTFAGWMTLSCSRQQSAEAPPFSPAESIRHMRVEQGWRVEPVIAEPHVVAPAAMDWDEEGRIWVVENPGYPLNVEGKVGKIKLLEDTNGDGLPDKSTVFADKLTLPTGVMRWKRGILVTDAPDLWYMEDRNGDSVADKREKLLTGFALTNPQHTVNSPVYGLDNWIYLAHENPTTAVVFKDKFGDRGSDIRFANRTDSPVVKQIGRGIRFRPDTFQLEALSGTSQFGHAFDDWGHHFTMNNTYHARHEVIAARYLNRNPALPLATSLENISTYGQPSKVFPIAPRQRFEMLTTIGEFTSACGMLWYRDSIFVAEPAHNLVHRANVRAAGATFAATRQREGVEFLASTDPWFRPVNFYQGPDNAMYMLDYYRLVIEHPEWMSQQMSQPKDLNEGNDRGRIYRLTQDAGGLQPPGKINLAKASDEQLVAMLDHENRWWRRTAQRLLMDRKPGTLPDFQPKTPQGRVHWLWTLHGLGKLQRTQIEDAVKASEPGVRENAIVLGELSGAPELAMTLANDADTRVRFQALATLGGLNDAKVRAARDGILQRDVADRWMQIAALSASPGEAARLLARKPVETSLLRTIGTVLGAQAGGLEQALAHRPASSALLEGVAAGLKSAPPNPERVQTRLLDLFTAHPKDAAMRRQLLRILETVGVPAGAAIRPAPSTADPQLRADTISLLALQKPAPHRAAWERLAVAQQEPEVVQQAAVAALGRIPGKATGEFLIANWRNMTTAVRREAADAIYRDADRLPLVVAALRNGTIQPWALSFRHKSRLIMHRDEAIRKAARPLLEGSPGDRQQVVTAYAAALDGPKADAARGQRVFEEVCSKCHRLAGGKGADVGPDLATVRNQPKQVLLEAILDPNRSISQGFEAYVVETAGAGTLDGVLGPQTPTTLTLRHEEGKQDVIQRKDIRSLRVTDLSAMPADLEKQIPVERMADLLAYLKQ